jgi:hypothetical protein
MTGVEMQFVLQGAPNSTLDACSIDRGGAAAVSRAL